MGLWRTLHFRDKIKNGFIKAGVLPLVKAIAVRVIVFAFNFMAQDNARYSVDIFVDTAQSMQGCHYQEGANTGDEHGRGSSYTLGDYDQSSWQGLLKIFPAVVNVTYFRPYIWMVKNEGMLAQAIESLVFLLATVFILLKVGPLKVYRSISNDSFLLMCVVLLFSLDLRWVFVGIILGPCRGIRSPLYLFM